MLLQSPRGERIASYDNGELIRVDRECYSPREGSGLHHGTFDEACADVLLLQSPRGERIASHKSVIKNLATIMLQSPRGERIASLRAADLSKPSRKGYSPREGSGLHQQNDTIRMQLICAIRLDFLYYSTLINGEQDRICAKSTKVRQDFVIS